MMTSSAMICETESLLSEHNFEESELDLEFGVRNQEGDISNPSFSTDVSDEEGKLYINNVLYLYYCILTFFDTDGIENETQT